MSLKKVISIVVERVVVESVRWGLVIVIVMHSFFIVSPADYYIVEHGGANVARSVSVFAVAIFVGLLFLYDHIFLPALASRFPEE